MSDAVDLVERKRRPAGRSRFVVACAIWAVACSRSDGPSAPTPPSVGNPTTFSLSGSVVDGRTQSPISGATITIADGPSAGKTAVTDGAGGYTFSALPLSGFTVTASADRYTSLSKSVTLTSNQTVSFQLAPLATPPATFTISGVVTDGTSGGVLPNITVQILDGVNAGKAGRTDGAGAYAISDVTAGTLSLSASAVSYQTSTSSLVVSGNMRVDFVLQRVAPSCSFSVSPLSLSYTRGGFAVSGPFYSIVITASSPTCAWTATNDPNDWVFLQVQGSSAPFGHSVSGIGSAVVLAGANAYGGTSTRSSVTKVRWDGGGVDVVACQPNCGS